MRNAKNKTVSPRRVYGVIGDPISHSKSPAMHTAALKSLKLPAEYRAFHVRSEELTAFFQSLRAGDLHGLNVTIPHKLAAATLVDVLTPEAKRIGAVNTVFLKGKKLIGHNTDGLGYLRSLKSEVRFSPQGKNVIVIGAGGAALAICHALCASGAKSLLLANRSLDKAQKLAHVLCELYPKTPVKAASLDELSLAEFRAAHLLVNTTSLGMNGNEWPSLAFLQGLKKGALVSDIVYNPKLTPLLKAAKKAGLRVHYGLGMLLFQGALAFEKFTGKPAPVSVMRQALERSLRK